MLKVREEQYTFGFVRVFDQQGPCTWSLPCLYEQVHFKQNMEEFYNSQTPRSEGPGSTSANTLSRILPTPHFELLSKQRTWVTPYQEVQTSRSTPNQMMYLKDKKITQPEKANHQGRMGRLPRRSGKVWRHTTWIELSWGDHSTESEREDSYTRRGGANGTTDYATVGYFKRKQKIRKCTDIDVAFTREYSRVSIFPQGTWVY